MNRYFSYFILLLLGSGLLGACSAERHNPLARLYQNTTARYNAFFLGNERLKALEADVAAKTIPDYNRLLPIFVPIDSTAAAGMRKELDEIIKKASYPIQKHPNSDWTDDSYLLIGKARFYGREFEDAIKTFRYINSTSQKEETRHEALVWLMRSFVTVEDLESARAVSDVMKKQFLNQENASLLFLTRAQYHLLRKEIPLSIENLKLALPLIEKKDEEARIRFILAQLYQQTNQDKLAYREYTRILRKNPPYELGFQSKLHLGQVTELSNTADLEKIDKYFRKLEKDVKNKEFLDKIHYERALFELKQDKPDLALQQLQQSVRLSTSNPSQKGYSYLLAGQIYYDKKQQYRLAHAYYDSAVQVLPPTAFEYAAAVERRDVLHAFANNLGTVEREDSLLALAQLPKAELDKRIEEIITQEAERQAAEAEKAAALAQRPAPANFPGSMGNTGNSGTGNTGNSAGNNSPGNSGSQSAGGLWYFDNPVTIASARSEFARRWGNRRLQDNWRTSNQQGADPQQDLAAGNTPAAPAGPAGETPDQQQALRTKLLQDIPLSAEQKKAALGRMEEAYFNLGGIYRLQLKEPARAAETYEKLLSRFPQTNHAAEVYYTLYLMYREANDAKQNQYASLLKQRFPGSRYARLVDDPDYLTRVSAGNKEVANLFDEAFSLYEKQQYPAASQVISRIRQQYPDSDLNDKVSFLAVRIVGQTEQPVLFKMALQDFIKRYPNSPLTGKAREYLDALALYEQGKLSEAEFDKTHPPKAVPESPAPTLPAPTGVQQKSAAKAATIPAPVSRQPATAAAQPAGQAPAGTAAPLPNNPPAGQPAASPPASNPAAAQTQTQPQTQPQAQPPVTPVPGGGQQASPAGPAVEAPARPRFADVTAASPQLVVIAYPKGHAAFTGVLEKVQGYNSKYNAADKLSVQAATLNPAQDLVVVGTFANAQKARIYVSKQKTPQSPLSKIRGIEFATFVVSPENLPLLLQAGKLEEYLTFYKNNY
ncbi:MAG: tetratricopeptide repeat protein [Adhaeribacter sp.]